MAAPTFTQLVAGAWQSVKAAIIGGAGSANQVVATNAAGVLDISFFPAGIGQDTVTCPASEVIAAGAPINFWLNSGALNMRNADGTVANGGKKAHGFVIAGAASGANGTAYRSGQNTGQTGLTVGSEYYLGASGAVSLNAQTTSGTTSQYLGVALSATVLDFQIGPPVGIQ